MKIMGLPRPDAPQSIFPQGTPARQREPTRIQAYYQNASGTWTYWTQSPAFAASSTWTTPAIPAGATALSFGTNLAAAGSLTADDYIMTGH